MSNKKKELKIFDFDILEPLGYIKSATLAFTVFVSLNLILGTISLWSPLLLSGFRRDISFYCQFINQFQQGNLYLFSIPFLATSLGGLLSALADDQLKERRVARLAILLISSFILGAMVLFLLYQTGSGTTPVEEQTFFTVFILQPAMFIISFILGVYIFCLANYHTLQQTHAKDENENRDNMNTKAEEASVDDVNGLSLESN